MFEILVYDVLPIVLLLMTMVWAIDTLEIIGKIKWGKK